MQGRPRAYRFRLREVTPTTRSGRPSAEQAAAEQAELPRLYVTYPRGEAAPDVRHGGAPPGRARETTRMRFFRSA